MNAQTLPRRQRLTFRITALFVALAVALLLAVGALLIVLSFQAQRSAIADTQREIAREAALQVSAFLAAVEQGLRVIAQTQNLADLDSNAQRVALAQMLETLPAFDELTYLDARGVERAKVSPYHTFTPDELRARSGDPGFRAAMSGERYLSDITFSTYSGQPVVSLALPVADLRQTTVGVLVAQVNFHRMWDIVTGLQVGERGYAYVVDESGRLIAYRDLSPVLQHRELSHLPTVAGAATAEYRGLAGSWVVGAQAPIANTPWAVVVELPTDEAYASLYRMMGLLAVLLLVGVAAAIVTGRSLTRYVVRPIEIFQAGAATIGDGNLEHSIELKTGDELQALAEAFNTMAHNLQRSQTEIERWNRELEALVTERTAALQAANLQLKALARVSHSLNAALALPDALNAVADASRVVLGAGRCAVYLLDPETDELQCVLAQGVSPDYAQRVSETYRAIPAAQVLNTQEPLVMSDAANDPRLAPIQDAVRREGYRSLALLPLVYGDQTLGMLTFYHENERAYSADDLELAQTFANQAALAIRNARLYDQSRDVAILEERNRLAREMHDTLIQDLTGIVVQLEAAERAAAKQPERATGSVGQAKRLARASLEEARRTLWNLRPSPLEHLGLSAALRGEVARLDHANGVRASFATLGDETRLPPQVELNLFRIAQEALTNARKHARARHIAVELRFDETHVQLTVCDDGSGGLNGAVESGKGGMGLISMRERTHLLGGEFHVTSPVGAGTRIVVKVNR